MMKKLIKKENQKMVELVKEVSQTLTHKKYIPPLKIKIMNWEKIKEKYPESYKILDLWVFRKWAKTLYAIDTRDLYDFFDEQEIVFNGGFFFNSVLDEYGYSFSVMQKIAVDFALILPEDQEALLFETLTEAEEQAFLKAFEILEEKL